MRLFSYVVARDYGFAPNPFYGHCTLATCKPNIRRVANVDDWIIGTGSGDKKIQREGYLVFYMKINETLTFTEYWNDPRFIQKKPTMLGSRKQAFGDNIYTKKKNGEWEQTNSHHSYNDGSPNNLNIENDTQTDRVLISSEYCYWGGEGPAIDPGIRHYEGIDICAKRNHKSNFPTELVSNVVTWLTSLNGQGYQGKPWEWKNAKDEIKAFIG